MHPISGESLWIGHCGDLQDIKPLFDAGIEAIVDLGREEPFPDLPREFIYCRFPLVDGGGNAATLLQTAIATTAQLLHNRVPTVVVCGMGMSRSPSVAAAALAMHHGEPLDPWLHKVSAVKSMDLSLDLWSDVTNAVKELQAGKG
jgi:hypothetical protein